jgi:prepilin-type N-terminal cleavage/methylation domain-containing protein
VPKKVRYFYLVEAEFTVEKRMHGQARTAFGGETRSMNRIRKTKGFTLVEIMIVVLIIGILMAIAVPNFIKARQGSRQKTVIANLKQVDSAKEQWAMETGQVGNAACSSSDLYPTYMKSWPDNTPVTGTYVPNAVGTAPTFLGKDQTQWANDPSGL